MNETMRKWWARISPWWNKFQPSQRRNLIIALVAALVCLAVIFWVVLRPRYVTVMTGLDNKSLGQVQTELQTLKIPDQIVGTSVQVPSKDADTARVQLAMAGLPQSGYIGYSSVSSSFGMTQDQFNLQVLDALQQSLNETIQSINGIESAQVHIVMPNDQLFVSQPQSDAKASVFVQVGNGVQLSGGQVAGIQQLVAHSVKGLTPDSVTVVDQNGVTLSSSASNTAGAAGNSSSEMAMRQNLEQTMTQQLTQGLNQIVGAGNAVVMVHADVTFNQVQTSSRVYQPAAGQTTGLPSSVQTTRTSSSQGAGGAASGTAGQSSTNPNLPSYAGTGTGTGSGSNSSSTSTNTTYDNSEVDTQTVNDPIQLNGYKVGIFLNASDKSLTPAVVAQIKSFVQNAIGVQTASAITVATMPFNTVPQGGALTKSGSSAYLWAGAAAFALLVGGVFMMRRRSQKRRTVEAEPEPIFLENLDETPMSEDERMKAELARLANKKPDEFANLLRTWLAE